MPRTQCISVIDEADTFTQAAFDADWATFRADYPDRQFWLLTPRPAYTNELRIPTAYISDPLAYGNINVNRDGGVVANRSDWFAICNLGSLPEGSVISVAIDTSGSMTLGTVQASYDYFKQRCEEAGLSIVFDLTFPNERWIVPHLKDIPPSANFSILDPDDGTSKLTIEIVSGESATLQWIIFGDVTTAEISPDVGVIDPSDYESSTTVSPTTDTTYALNVDGPAGITTRSVEIIVLTPPTLFINSTSCITNGGTTICSIIAGQCTEISWFVTGDADSIEWTSGNISNLNLSSKATVCPLDTTVYSATVDGRAGSASASITIIVYQIPVINSFSCPTSLEYGEQGTISYEITYANISATLEMFYDYGDGNGFVLQETRSITPIPDSSQIGVGTTSTSGDIDTEVVYNDFGPRRIQYVFTIEGNGGIVSTNRFVDVIIDETPDNFIIPETEDKFKDEEPVYTPDVIPGDVIITELMLIDGIDIPVEIKSNYPIQVDINNAEDWKSVREI